MKKITLLIAFVALFTSNQLQAQIDIDANWPNPNWETIGAYSASGLLGDPTIDANFSFDDNAAGSGSLFDIIGTQSPIIDLTPATTATPPQNEMALSLDIVFRSPGADVLTLEWYDQSTHLWNLWETFTANSTNFDYQTCSGTQTFTSQPLLINGFTIIQKIGFRYRFVFNDTHGSFGFCIESPTIQSQETPLCIPVSGITADNIDHNSADINWVDNNTPAPANGWEIEYGDVGFTQGSGTTATSTTGTYTITGLNAESCYQVYIRSLCSSTISSTWVGPYNFCTVAAGPVCGGHFYDSGGSIGQYSNGESTTTTINPDIAGEVVTVLFTAFDTESGYDDLSIYDGSSATSPLLGTFEGTNLPPTFEASLANGGSLTFVFHSDFSVTRDGWETNIFCGLPTTCFMTDNLAVNAASISITGATVTWNDTNTVAELPAGGWMIEYGPVDFDQGTGTTDVIPLANGPTYDLTGLSGATEYDFYIKAICDATVDVDDSFWAGPVNFVTLCEVIIAADLPSGYNENFENDGDTPNCWFQGNNNNEDWMFATEANAPAHFGNGGTTIGSNLSGGYFAYIDDSFPDSMGTTLISPTIDLNGLTTPTLSLWFVSNDEGDFQNVNFSIDIWNGTTLTQEVFTQHGNTIGWEQVFINLDAFANQVIEIRFIVDEINTNWKDDFAIDDIYVGNLPTCVNVTNINVDDLFSEAVTLSWTDGGNIPPATAWEIEYGLAGFTQGTIDGTIIPANTNPFTINGLTPQTDYDVYVRSDCGAGDYSLWAGPIPFTTLCPVIDAPYTEDFEDNGVIDVCWSQNDNSDPWEFSNDITFPGHVGNNGNAAGTHTDSDGYFAYVDDSGDHILNNTLTTPLINVGTLIEPVLSFFYLSHDEGSTHVDFSVDVWDGAQWNTDQFTSATNTAGWQKIYVNIAALNITGPVQARFIVNENNGNDFNDDLAIDDVTFDEAPSCYPPSDLAIANETLTTVDVSWTDNNTTTPAGGWDVEVVWATFPPGTGVVTTVFTTSTTITDLIPSTYYDIYVTANCAADGSDSSDTVGPIGIKTINGLPLNDICGDAIELTVNVNCEPVLGNNILSTQTTPPLATDCADPAVDGLEPGFVLDDVWYKFTMPATGTVIIQTAFAGWMDDSALSIYTGTCGNLTIVENYNADGSNNNIDTCSDDADADLAVGTNADDNEMGIVQLTNQTDYIGEEFYIRVWSVDRTNLPAPWGENIHGQFSICVFGQPHTRPAALTITDNEIDTEFNLTYYPNPVTNELHLSTDDAISEIRVYSVLGQEVIREKLNNPNSNYNLNVENLEAGTYFVKVKIGSKTKTVKIIKI